MAYIGNIPAEKFTSVDIQNFTVSATANYTLDRPVANENEIELFINNVRQHPGSGKAYTASGTALTLSEATAGTDTMYCVYQGKARQTVTPATSSVTNAMLAGSIALTSKVTGALPQANIADQAINEAKMQISNAPTNGYMLTAQSGNTGGLTWAEAPSGALVKLVQAHSLSDVSVVNVDSIFSSIYSAYRLVGTFKPTNSSVDARFRWRASSSDLSVSQYYGSARGGYVKGSGAGSTSFSDWGTSYARLAQNLNNNNYNALQLDILLYPYNNTGAGNIGSINNASSFIFAVNYWRDASGEQQEQNSGGYTYTQTTVADGFALYPTAGDWDGYNYAVFGYKG